MIRGLIERSPDPEHPSGFLYRLTFDAMKHLGIQQKEDLPDFSKFQELLKVFDSASAEADKSAEQELASPKP
jgi:chromosome segregation and condensation protein ScpB